MSLNTKLSNVTLSNEDLPQRPKFHSVPLYRRSFSRQLGFVGFPIGDNGELQEFVKIRNSKFQKEKKNIKNSTFVRRIEKNVEKNFKIFYTDLREE